MKRLKLVLKYCAINKLSVNFKKTTYMLLTSSEKLSFTIFADDTYIFFTGSNPNKVEFTMNEEIKLILKYCAINKLSINFKKTNYMLLTLSKKKYI